MNYFAFPLKCKKLYKKINGASELSYKLSKTRSPFLRSVTGGSQYKSDVGGGGGSASSCLGEGVANFGLTVGDQDAKPIYFPTELLFPYRYRLGLDEFILSSLGLYVKKLYLKKAKRHHTLLKYRLL